MTDDSKPWEDESLASPETKVLKKKTQALRMKPPSPVTRAKAKPAPSGLTSMNDAYSLAEKLKKRNELVSQATKGVRKMLPGQEE